MSIVFFSGHTKLSTIPMYNRKSKWLVLLMPKLQLNFMITGN